MAHIALSIGEVQMLINPLIGLTVSLPWKGYGSAIFFELGRLAPLESPRQRHNNGEACISVEWDWRVESHASVLYGSSNSGPKIEEGIAGLQGTTIQGLSVVGTIPEIVVKFSNGLSLRSMVMVTGHPEWSIRLPDGRWLFSRNGELFAGKGESCTTEQEEAAFASAERTANRWGVPIAEPKAGSCAGCSSFVRIDGNGHLLDYGVCTSAFSPFDGRAVNRTSGCPLFKSNAET
jgi:hypothetical protein